MHMVAARLGFEKAMVGTRWATPRPDCMDRLRKHYSHLAEGRVGQGEVGGVTGRVLCTWWLLGLALKRPWLVPGGPPHALTAWTGLENTTLTLQRAGFLQERLLGL